MMHWQTYNLLGHTICYRQVLFCCTWQCAICVEVANQRVEIATSQDILLLEGEVEFISCTTKPLGIDKYGEVGVVLSYPLKNLFV